MFFIFLIFEILPFIVVSIIIFSVIINVGKRSKANNAKNGDFKNTISNANDPQSYGNAVSQESLDTYCAYCGSKFSKIKKRCPSCGAKIDEL